MVAVYFRRFLIVVGCVLTSLQVFAQQIPLHQSVQNRLNELLTEADTSIFTSFRGMNWLELQQLEIIQKTKLTDSVFGLNNTQPKGYFLKNITTDNWIKAIGSKTVFAIDPYIEATLMKSDEKDDLLSGISGGIRMAAVLNNKFSFNFDFITQLNQFPKYVDSVIKEKGDIIPGGNAAVVKDNNRYAYSHFNFDFTYTPKPYFLISAGYGKQFIGDGYRSLLLSDNAFNYPYIRLQTKLWRITYNVLYSYYINKNWYKVDGKSQPKFSTMHYVGVNIFKKLQVGVFDQITWLSKDTNMQRGFEVQYLNPLIFMRPLEFAIGSPDNAMIGFTFKYQFYKNGFLYGQIGIDDLNLKKSFDNNAQHYGNKYALQLGIWNKDLFRVPGLSYRLEWNGVRPYTYGHGVGDNISLNYTHYYQPLAHPLGANFHEFISLLNYTNQRWYGTLENLFTIRGENPGLPYNNGEDLWGGEENVPPFGSTTLQGIKHYYFYNQLSVGYLINPKNRLSFQADVIYRNNRAQGANLQSEFFVSFGLKMNLFNYYNDF